LTGGIRFSRCGAPTLFGFQESTDPIYKSIPFFLAVRGSRRPRFLRQPMRGSFDFGKSQGGVYSYSAEGGALDYYILMGRTRSTF